MSDDSKFDNILSRQEHRKTVEIFARAAPPRATVLPFDEENDEHWSHIVLKVHEIDLP